MKSFWIGIALLVIGIIGLFGCATQGSGLGPVKKTEKGESIATARLVNDINYFENDHLVKVAFEWDIKSPFYGVQGTYMNDVAYTAFTSGKNFPEGSEITLAFFDFNKKDNVIVPTQFMWSAVMGKSLSAVATGGWKYYSFPDGKVPEPDKGCYISCHQAQKSNDYLFLKH